MSDVFTCTGRPKSAEDQTHHLLAGMSLEANKAADKRRALAAEVAEEIKLRIQEFKEAKMVGYEAAGITDAPVMDKADVDEIVRKVKEDFEYEVESGSKSKSKTEKKAAKDEENRLKNLGLLYNCAAAAVVDDYTFTIGDLCPHAFYLRCSAKHVYKDIFEKVALPYFERYKRLNPTRASHYGHQFAMNRDVAAEVVERFKENESANAKLVSASVQSITAIMTLCLVCEHNCSYEEAGKVIVLKRDGNDELSFPATVESSEMEGLCIAAYYTKLFKYCDVNFKSSLTKVNNGGVEKQAYRKMQKPATKQRREQNGDEDDDGNAKGFRHAGKGGKNGHRSQT